MAEVCRGGCVIVCSADPSRHTLALSGKLGSFKADRIKQNEKKKMKREWERVKE